MPTLLTDADKTRLLNPRRGGRDPQLHLIGYSLRKVPMTGRVHIKHVFTLQSPKKGLCHLLVGTDDGQPSFSVQTDDMDVNALDVMFFTRSVLVFTPSDFKTYARDRIGMDPDDLIAVIKAAYRIIDPPIAPVGAKK